MQNKSKPPLPKQENQGKHSSRKSNHFEEEIEQVVLTNDKAKAGKDQQNQLNKN